MSVGVISVLLFDDEREGAKTMAEGDIRAYNEDGV